MSISSLPDSNTALAVLMREKLGVGGEDRLDAKLRRAANLLPRGLRKDAKYLADVENICRHPKLSRQVDLQRARRAERNLRRHLEALDPWDRRLGKILGVLVPLAFNFLLIGAGVIVWLVLSGRV